MKIIIITPVRNEGQYIRLTMECMLAQTLPPLKWIIADDGSTDETAGVVREGMRAAPFMEYLALPDRGFRRPGQGVVEAFYEGFKAIGDTDYDIVAKFDGDLKFPHYMLEKVCEAFLANPELGITGATRYEQRVGGGPFRKVLLPKGFVGGPTKFYRRECFEEINGLIPRAGWDGVDTVRANMKGWETGEVESLRVVHLRPTGTARGEGPRRAWEKYGDVGYYMGGYLWYFVLRVIGRSLESRSPAPGFYMLKGYIGSFFKNIEREQPEFRRHLKKVQRRNMLYWVRLALGGLAKGFRGILRTAGGRLRN